MKPLVLAYSSLNDQKLMKWPNGIHTGPRHKVPDTHTPGSKRPFNTTFFTWDICCKKYKVDELPENEKYIYPIHVECIGFWNGRYLNEALDIPASVIEDVKNDRARIVFNMVKEGQGFKLDNRLSLIQNQIKFLGLSNKHVFFIDSNIKNTRFLRSHKLKGLYYSYWECYNPPLSNTEINKIVKDIELKKDRDYKFLSFNRRAADFRIMLVKRLFDLGIDKESILTCGPDVSITNYSNNYPEVFTEVQDVIKSNFLPITYDVKNLRSNNPLEINFNAHLNSYVNLCCETFFENEDNRLFFSEKIFKPIIALQPFIILGQSGSLDYLKKVGYQTFHPFINEDYDSETNDVKRFNMIIDEVQRLNSISKDDLNEMLIKLLPRLKHNARLYEIGQVGELRSHKVIKEIFHNWDQELK